MKTYKFLYPLLTRSLLFILVTITALSCDPTIDEKYIATFKGDMIYSYLEKDSANYSEFKKFIDKTGFKGMLNAYGRYTCLVPTNAAFKEYYKTKGENFKFDSLTEEEVKYITKTHILGQTYLVQNLSNGVFPSNNMNDRVIELLYSTDTTKHTLKILLNKQSEILERDIEVYNGVIQKISKVLTPSTTQLPDLMATDPEISIFNEALKITGLTDSIAPIEDRSYKIPTTQYLCEPSVGTFSIPSPAKRKYGFTAFVESDNLFKSKGINSIEDLIAKAKEWYPSDSRYDNEYTNRNNSLNKFISYHLVEKVIYTNKFFFSQHAVQDALLYEFIETMYNNRLMKVSNQKLSVGYAALVNPESANELYVTSNYKTTINGVYHYVSDILLYTNSVESTIASSRIRFDYSALLPEMMNNNLRLTNGTMTFPISSNKSDRWGIPPGYFKYLKMSNDTRLLYLAGCFSWGNYQGDEMMGIGNYDITVRLMPVPPGTYELRFAYTANSNRSVTQIYVDNKPVGIPLDLTVSATDPRIGWLADNVGTDNGVENDKAMHNRGYVKGPTTYGLYDKEVGGVVKISRNQSSAMRRVIGVFTFNTYEAHYVRFKSVIEKPAAQCMMDYFEYVPKTIYAPPGGDPESRD